MNKTVTINLGGQIFYVEESVFNTLQTYLESLKRYFNNDPDGNEIISDIEYRLAELFIEGQQDRNTAISEEQVLAAISTMGTVSDFQEASESDEHSSLVPATQAHTSQESDINKKLLRDPDDRVLSGVSSGLGHYFGINALWVRISFLLLFFFQGIGLIPYLILWIIMPKAVSSSDKLAMKGKPINLNTLRENVKTGIESNSGNAVDFLNQLFKYTGTAIITLFRLGLIFFGFLFLLVGIAAIIGLGFLTISGGQLPMLADTFIGLNSFWYVIMRIAMFLAIAIPVVLFAVLFLRLLLNRNFLSDRRYVYALATVWLFSVLALVLTGSKIKSDFKYEGQNLESFEFVNTYDTLKIAVDSNYKRNGNSQRHIKITSDDFKIINDTLYSDAIDLDIVPADISTYRLDVIKSAKGSTVKKGEILAAGTNYYWEHKEDKLLLAKLFSIPENAKWRKQDVKLVLNVPYNQIIHLDRSTRNLINDVENVQNIYDRDMAGRSWSSSRNGLSCLNCDAKKMISSSDKANDEINAIDIEGALSLKVIQSSNNKVEYSDELRDIYDFTYQGNKLLIRPIEDNINGEDLAGSSAEIYVSDLSDLYIKGLAEVDLKDLKGDHIDIKIEGAAQTDFELDYTTADIEIQGAANVDMSGKVDNLDLRAEGMMRIDADDLKVKNADIDMEGAMRADFYVTENLDITLEGPSYIKYKGNPVISKSLSGPSRLVRM